MPRDCVFSRLWSGIVPALFLLAPAVAAAGNDAVPDTLVQRIAACAACHGKQGQGGGNGYYPRIAGKPALYLYRQLRNFQAGRRDNPMMRHMVTGLSDSYLREIADHYAGMQPPHRQRAGKSWPKAVLARGQQLVRHGDPQRKVPACQACHGARLTGVQPATPALIGLPADYISAQLGAWHSHTRAAPPPDCMATVAARLDEQDIHAIAAWLASQSLPADPAPMPADMVDPPLECGSLQP